jgi:hypothetical protein
MYLPNFAGKSKYQQCLFKRAGVGRGGRTRLEKHVGSSIVYSEQGRTSFLSHYAEHHEKENEVKSFTRMDVTKEFKKKS